MPSYSFLIAGCGSAGRSVAHVAAQDGRGQIADELEHLRGRRLLVAVATDGSGDDAPTFVVGLLAAGNDVFEGRWHYRCGPPRANRKETLDDAEFATWWATEARALLLMA